MDLDRLVQKALAKRVDERYASAEGLLVDLRVLSRAVENESTSGRGPAVRNGLRSLKLLGTNGRPSQVRSSQGVARRGFDRHWFWRSSATPAVDLLSRAKLTRLTRSAGLNTTPALSRDGSLMAYASDRGGEGQPGHLGAAGCRRNRCPPHLCPRRPITAPRSRRTARPSHFNPTVKEGEIYVIPTLGGAPRLLVQGGQRPRYSRDGRAIAYHAGPPSR